VDEVEDFAQVAAEPVEGVHDDRVAGAGVGEQVGKSGTLDGGAALTPPLRSALLRNNPDIAV
jgi:hypothetical protein